MKVVSVWGILVLAAIATSATAQPVDVKEIEKRCATAEEAGELKACIASYGEIYRKLEAEHETFIDLVTGCLDRKTAREVRACIVDGGTATSVMPAPKTEPVPKAPPVAPQSAKNEWRVEEETSRMDGSPSVFMSMLAEEPILNNFGGKTTVSLHIRCKERVTNLFVAADWFLGTARAVPVMLRIDQEKPFQQSWEPSTNGKAAGLWNGASAIPFLKSLFGKETLLIRLAPYSESSKEMAFPIGDLAKAIEPLRKACGW